jgi:hypothetical protein
MTSQTCAYVANRDDPENWERRDLAVFGIDDDPEDGGLGVREWRCPHPSLGGEYSDEKYCVFHTHPAEVPVGIDEQEELLKALDNAGNKPRSDRPEHRGQFVGATFGAIDLSSEEITATDDHDIRFDHARFQTQDGDLDFSETTFETQGDRPISFIGAEFVTNSGKIWFNEARFVTNGSGSVQFRDTMFQAKGDGDVVFWKAVFQVDNRGDIGFRHAIFQADNGNIWFRRAEFLLNRNGI